MLISLLLDTQKIRVLVHTTLIRPTSDTLDSERNEKCILWFPYGVKKENIGVKQHKNGKSENCGDGKIQLTIYIVAHSEDVSSTWLK